MKAGLGPLAFKRHPGDPRGRNEPQRDGIDLARRTHRRLISGVVVGDVRHRRLRAGSRAYGPYAGSVLHLRLARPRLGRHDDSAWNVGKRYHALRWKYSDISGSRTRTRLAFPPPMEAEAERALIGTIICGSAGEVLPALR